MQFNLNNIVDDNQYKARFAPGIHEVEILSVADKANKNDKPYIGVVITDADGSMEHEEQMYVTTDKAVNAMMIKVKEMYEAVYGKGKFPTDISTEQINKDLAGRKLRVKLNGEEYLYEDKKYIRPSFPYRHFAESLQVDIAVSKLRFNPERDIKALPVEEAPQRFGSEDIQQPQSASAPTNLKFS